MASACGRSATWARYSSSRNCPSSLIAPLVTCDLALKDCLLVGELPPLQVQLADGDQHADDDGCECNSCPDVVPGARPAGSMPGETVHAAEDAPGRQLQNSDGPSAHPRTLAPVLVRARFCWNAARHGLAPDGQQDRH
jgi:hypothetical protein